MTFSVDLDEPLYDFSGQPLKDDMGTAVTLKYLIIKSLFNYDRTISITDQELECRFKLQARVKNGEVQSFTDTELSLFKFWIRKTFNEVSIWPALQSLNAALPDEMPVKEVEETPLISPVSPTPEAPPIPEKEVLPAEIQPEVSTQESA